MLRHTWILIFVGFLIPVPCESASAGEYTDPSGFSLSYPDGWTPVSREILANLKDELPQDLKNWIANNKLDFNQIKMVLIREGEGDFLANLNVVVFGKQIPVNDASAKAQRSASEKELLAAGATLDNLRSRVQKFGSRDAVVLEFDSHLPSVPFALRQKQVFFPGGGKTYVVTCTTKAGAPDDPAGAFDSILASFKVPAPAPIATGVGVAPAALIGAAAGGIAGAIAFLRNQSSGKKKKKKRKKPPGPVYRPPPEPI